MTEPVLVEARLVGNNTGKVYAQNQMSVETIFKEPELYCGDCLLSIPMYPVIEKSDEPFAELDPEDTEVILQFRTNSPDTKIGGFTAGHWRATFEKRPNTTVEIPTYGIRK